MFPQLTTNRLLLQKITWDDQQFIFEGLSHPEVIPFYGVRYDTFEATAVQIEWYERIWLEGSGISWKIVDKTSGENLGVITIYFYKPEHNKAEVGFWLKPSAWNKGFASEALHAVTEYWRTKKHLHRLEAFVEQRNTASSKLLEKTGFVFEGTMRDCEMKNGKYISLHVYSLLLN